MELKTIKLSDGKDYKFRFSLKALNELEDIYHRPFVEVISDLQNANTKEQSNDELTALFKLSQTLLWLGCKDYNDFEYQEDFLDLIEIKDLARIIGEAMQILLGTKVSDVAPEKLGKQNPSAGRKQKRAQQNVESSLNPSGT